MGKLSHRVEEYGLWGAIKLTWSKLFRRSRRSILKLKTPEERFTKIYETNNWSNPESVSGEGSTRTNTAKLREALPGFFERRNFQTVLDAPCGDFNWMQHVIKETPITYIGGDIVKPLMDENNKNHGSDRVTFQHLDITTGSLPKADLMICRDSLFHLSYEDIFRFFANFAASDIPYLLTTTHGSPDHPLENSDIITGRMRPIDLFSAPFNLSKDYLEKIEDSTVSKAETRYMVLFTRDQIAAAASQQ